MPRVSILLPCLNARPFLDARLDSLLAQTVTDWEAIVLDGYSDDGSWEFFEAAAATDDRFHLHRLPREGLYAALNQGIELARGEFLYIATCDDTMEPDFLETMLGAFAQAPEAGIAACDLRFIDATGQDAEFAGRLGAEFVRTATLGERADRANYRPSPHDCWLHLAGDTVYYSLTQLVVRTSLAREAPRFRTDKGSFADFGWSLNLTGLAGTVHVPRKLATWRLHGNQLSMKSNLSHNRYIPEMCLDALPRLFERHRARLTRDEYAALSIPAKLMLAQSGGRRTAAWLVWLEALRCLLWLGVALPAATLRALRGVRYHPGHLKQAWIAFLLRRSGVRLKPVD